MKLVEFLEKNNINYCPINLEKQENGKWGQGQEYNSLTYGTKFTGKENLFWNVKKDIIKSRKENIHNFKHLLIDCRIVWQLDVDIEDNDDFELLEEEAELLYSKIEKQTTHYQSNNKVCGLHSFILDKNEKNNKSIDNLIEKTKNIKRLTDINNKNKKGKNKYLNEEYSFLEIIKDFTWGTIDREVINDKYNNPIKTQSNTLLLKIIKKEWYDITTVNNEKKMLEQKEKRKNSLKKKSKPIISKEEEEELKKNLGIEETEIVDYEIAEYNEYILNIDKKYWNTNNDCFKIIGSIKTMNNELLKNTFKNILKQSDKIKSNFNEWYDKQEENSKKYTFNNYTLKTFSKNSNTEQHYKIKCKYDIIKQRVNTELKLSSDELAQIFLNNNLDNVIVNEPETIEEISTIYFYDPVRQIWVNQGDKTKGGYNCNTIKLFIGKELTTYLFNLYNLEFEQDEPNECAVKLLLKRYEDIKEPALKNTICESLVQYIQSHNLVSITFDNIPLKLVFSNNVVFDFELMTPVYKIEKDDYILTKLPYNWKEEDQLIQEEYELFCKFYDELMLLPEWDNEEQEKQFKARQDDLTYFMCMCLIGKKQALLFILNASGRNGKSLLMKILHKVLTNNLMCNSMNSSILTKDIDGERGIPELAKLHNIRASIFNECDENKPLCITTIKKMLGEDILQVRKLFDNSMNKNIGYLTAGICLNERPHFDGTGNEGLNSKIIDLYFPNTFVDSDDSRINTYKYTEKIKSGYFYEKDTSKMDGDFADRMKWYMLKYLINFMKRFKEENNKNIWDTSWKFSELTRARTKDYISSLNNISEWVNSQVIHTQDVNECINIYDELWALFTKSQEYLEADIKKRPKKERFKNDIKNSDVFGEFYNEKNTTRNKKKLMKSGWLEGFILKSEFENIPTPEILVEENTSENDIVTPNDIDDF